MAIHQCISPNQRMFWLIKCQTLTLDLILVHNPNFSLDLNHNFLSFLLGHQSQVPVQNQFQFPFTPKQCQKLLAMIGGQEAPSTSLGMAKNVSLPIQQTTPLAGIFSQPNFGIKHSVFAAKIVNKISWLNTVLSKTLLVGGRMIGVGEVSNGLYLL